MAKKAEQWSIDRAFNFTLQNEAKVKSVLGNLKKVKDGAIGYDDALNNMVTEGSITTIERYERSTQTAYKSMGLILSKSEISPIGEAFAKNLIDYRSLLLLQCFKKQYNKNVSYKVRPLIVTLSVLMKIYKNPSTSDLAWVDPYDYVHYLTEVHDYSDIDACVSQIIADKALAGDARKIDEIADCDIWYNLFEATGLFVKPNPSNTYIISLNLDQIDLIQFLLEHHASAQLINSDVTGTLPDDEYWAKQFGALDNGLVEILPYFIRKAHSEIRGFNEDTIRGVLYFTLVEGMTTREVDLLLFPTVDDSELSYRGFFAQHIIRTFGIPASKGKLDHITTARGMFKPFRSYLSLFRLSSYYDTYDDIIEILLGNKVFGKAGPASPLVRKTGGENIIYYGTPGCGKSFLVNNLYEDKENCKVFRTVFHPEYSNTDFVGQIIPKIDETDATKITYNFEPGVFTKALVFAYHNPSVETVLIIEEINRGNASAIFGEIFQLLDRTETGESFYGIKHYKLAEQLEESEDFDVKLPSNLSIVATMNTSDQNVYSLDTAFKRRWVLKKIRNTFTDIDDPNRFADSTLNYKRDLAKLYIPGSSIVWREFVEKINAKISEIGKSFTIVSEDKEIGVYFVSKQLLSETPNNTDATLISAFAEKVLMYIWNDIAKTNINKWFFGCNTLDQLLDLFEACKTTDTLNVFKDNTGKKLFFDAPVGDAAV